METSLRVASNWVPWFRDLSPSREFGVRIPGTLFCLFVVLCASGDHVTTLSGRKKLLENHACLIKSLIYIKITKEYEACQSALSVVGYCQSHSERRAVFSSRPRRGWVSLGIIIYVGLLFTDANNNRKIKRKFLKWLSSFSCKDFNNN